MIDEFGRLAVCYLHMEPVSSAAAGKPICEASPLFNRGLVQINSVGGTYVVRWAVYRSSCCDIFMSPPQILWVRLNSRGGPGWK